MAQSVRSLAPVDAQMADLDRGLWMSIPLALLVAAVGGALLVGGAMRPIRRLTDSARRLESDLSGERLPTKGRDEFAELAIAFNEALDRTSLALSSQKSAIAQLERFTGDAGHELRTPLGAIKGSSSYLLHMTELPEDSRQSVCIIDRSADRMQRLIDDLLLLARHDAGKERPKRETVRIGDLIDESLEGLSVPPQIDVQVNSGADLVAETVPDSVSRVVTNLLSNAIAYAKTSVVVECALRNGYLEIEVADNGEGVPPEHLARLGERFYRPDDARSRAHGGTGLGLAIVKSLCESHGGDFSIASQVGVGTTAKARFSVRTVGLLA